MHFDKQCILKLCIVRLIILYYDKSWILYVQRNMYGQVDIMLEFAWICLSDVCFLLFTVHLTQYYRTASTIQSTVLNVCYISMIFCLFSVLFIHMRYANVFKSALELMQKSVILIHANHTLAPRTYAHQSSSVSSLRTFGFFIPLILLPFYVKTL